MESIQLNDNYEIVFFNDSYNNELVSLKINDTTQSISFTDNRKFILYDEYSYNYDIPCKIDNINTTLVLGGGTMSYPKYYISKYNNKYMDVIEINQDLINASYIYFYLNDLYTQFDPERKRLNIINDDCIHFINFTNKKYDYIFFDAYMGHDIVPAIYEYSTIQRLKSLLNENGYLGINYVIPNQDMYNKLMDVLTHNFDHIKEYGVVGNDQFKYILVSDKEIKSEDVI